MHHIRQNRERGEGAPALVVGTLLAIAAFAFVMAWVSSGSSHSHADAVRCEERGGEMFIMRDRSGYVCLTDYEVIDLEAPPASLPADTIERIEAQPRLLLVP